MIQNFHSLDRIEPFFKTKPVFESIFYINLCITAFEVYV